MRIQSRFLNVLGVAIGTIASASLFAATPGVTDKEIKIGGHMPTSGPFAIYGVAAKGAQMYFAKVNAEGGVHGRQINYIFEDDLGNPAKALEITKKFVQRENIFANFLSLTPTHSAVVDFLDSRKVPDMFFGDPSPKSNVFNKYRFPALTNASQEAVSLANYVVKHFPGKKVGIVAENVVAGSESFASAKKTLAGHNQVVVDELVDPGELNLQPQMAKLKSKNAEVVINFTGLAATAALMKTAAQDNYKPQWLVASYDTTYFLLDMAGANVAEGTIGQVALENEFSETPAMKDLVAKWSKVDPETPANLLVVYGYTNAEILVEVLKRAGKDLTRENFVAAAETLKNYKCTFCLLPINVDGSQHNLFPAVKYQVVKGGKWKPLN